MLTMFPLCCLFRYSDEGFVKETLLSLAELLQACGIVPRKLLFVVFFVELALFSFQCFEGYEFACKQAPLQV